LVNPRDHAVRRMNIATPRSQPATSSSKPCWSWLAILGARVSGKRDDNDHGAEKAIRGTRQELLSRGCLRLGEVLAAALESLFSEHCAPIAFHRGIVCGEQLSPDHALDLVFRTYPDERRDHGFALSVSSLHIRMLQPK
jgi:hypothetical protein